MHVLQNEILVTNPLYKDSSTEKSLILIVKEEVGFIINKPSDLLIKDALKDAIININSNVYYGGIYQTETIHFLHTCPEIEGCLEIANGVYWGGNLSILSNLCDTGKVTPKNVRFIAGWTRINDIDRYRNTTWMKLHDKYLDNNWVKSYLFSNEPENLYARALKVFGNNMSIFANIETPSLN